MTISKLAICYNGGRISLIVHFVGVRRYGSISQVVVTDDLHFVGTDRATA